MTLSSHLVGVMDPQMPLSVRKSSRWEEVAYRGELTEPIGVHSTNGYHSGGIKKTYPRPATGDCIAARKVGAETPGVQRGCPSDIQEQAAQAFTNVQAVVEQGGGKLEDIVKITAFLTDRANFAGYDRARKAFFSQDFPASTTVVVKELVDPDYLLEVEAVAVLSS